MDVVKLCEVCGNITHDDNFDLLENYMYQILDDLYMKLNRGISGDPIICNECTTYVQDFFDFKWKCLGNENIILSFKDTHENSAFDLKDVYLNENKTVDSSAILEDQKICRFCMRISMYEFTQLHDTKENICIISMLQKHVPELNLNLTEELIACNSCFDSLQTFHSFITKCAEAQEKITKFADSEGTDIKGYIQLNKVAEFTCNGDTVKQKGIYDEFEKEGNTCIKIKSENSLEDKADIGIKTEEIHLKTKLRDSSSGDTAVSPQCDIPMYNCQKCTFKTKWRWSLTLHNQTHQRPSELTMYKCDICPYKTRFKAHLKRHLLIHKDASELEMFKCHLCMYRAKAQSDLKRHMGVHQNRKAKMYKCDVCSYEANLKGRLKDHMLVHRSSSEVTMYKCTECTFETKYKRCLGKHSIIHKMPTEVFQCDSCSYKSGKLGYLKQHMSIHKEITLLECHECCYKTTNKRYFKKHMIVHKDPSEVTLYKCENCAYESKYKKSLKRHMVTHGGVRIGQ